MIVEKGGEWWLPNDDHRVPGVLKIDDDGGLTLTLIGSLSLPSNTNAGGRSPSSSASSSGWTGNGVAAGLGRVLGVADGFGYTLENGIQTLHTRNLLGGLPSQTIKFDVGYRGVYLGDGEPSRFDRVSVEMSWLTQWAAVTKISENFITEQQHRRREVQVAAEVQPRASVRLGNGRTAILRHSIPISGDGWTQREIGQKYVLETRTPHPVPLEELLSVSARVQALVSVATDRNAAFEAVILGHPRVVTPGQGTPVRRLPIDCIASWSVRDESGKPQPRHKTLFTMEDLGGFAAVGRWLRSTEPIQHQLDRVMATRYHPGMVGDQLFGRVAALEGYHKVRYGSRLPLRDRLRGCAARAGDPFATLVGDVETWVDTAVRVRNATGHGSVGEHYEAGRTLLLADAAYWLFILCLLRDMQAPARVFRKLSQSPSWTWLTNSLSSTAHDRSTPA